MSTEHTPSVLFRIGMIALIAIVSSGSEPSRLEATGLQTQPSTSIIVTTTAELEAALSPANKGVQILVRAGEYDVSHALTVPDGATLAGEGVMTFDEAGLPAGFEPAGRTLIRSTPALVGDILTLGDGSALLALSVQDVAGRAGNLVAVLSRAAGDFISASIEDCEIVNPNPLGITPQGPTGHGLAVLTRNPNLSLDPPPHEGAVLRVELRRSIFRSPGTGSGVFAINFASYGEIDLDLARNVIGGGLDSTGGVSRPDAVTGASVNIQSRHNLYRSDSPAPTPIGWRVIGGTTAVIPGLVSQASTFNSLRLNSSGDRIEGFAVGVTAIGGWRTAPLPEPSSSNRADLNLHGTLLQTATTDLSLTGASSLVNGVSPGDGNTVHLNVRQATGSGPRANRYANSVTPTMGDLGVGNRLEIVGSENDFDRTNEGFVPAPPAVFFTVHR